MTNKQQEKTMNDKQQQEKTITSNKPVYHQQKCGFRVQKFGFTYTVQTFQGKDGTHCWEIDVDGDERIFIDEMFIEALMSTMIMECPACGEEND